MARKILLADDSVTAQNMGRRILTDAGYEVVTVNNGSAALKRIADSKPDLIILDVYMPGYGGLEVCQRIRENSDTARIPVLLTVGKLEPFKAEEVRRVRADAHIIKPFEASELLTALTRLEDKIVPQPAPYKPGRFAKAMAAIEGSGVPSEEYGDPEKGWKNRLKIPPPDRKHREDESEEAPAAKAEAKESSAPSETAAPPTAAILRGVTAEEIAAIEAAAAALSGQTLSAAEPVEAEKEQAPQVEAEVVPSESNSEVSAEPPATFASMSADDSEEEPQQVEAEVPEPAPAIAASTEPAESVTEAPVELPEPVPAIEPAEIELQLEPVSSTPSEDHVDARSASAEEEVDAALASLAPANGHGVSVIPGIPGNGAAKGPRWIAEAVALSESESSVILEEEMQRALAAFAAVDAARSGWPAVEEVMTSSTVAVETPPAVVVDAVAESIVSTIEAPVPEAAVAEPEAAFAAAAGAEIVATPVDMPTSLIGVASEVAESSSTTEFDQQRESELAAAWASWKQVRDSVGSDQFTSQLADAAAAGLQDLPKQDTIATPEPPVEAAAAPEESGAIASIVDTVLAELKPRLMEEIAKKMKK